jgi:hypothetical protein
MKWIWYIRSCLKKTPTGRRAAAQFKRQAACKAIVLLLLLAGCENNKNIVDAALKDVLNKVEENIPIGSPDDPPYTNQVRFPSGLHLTGLVLDSDLTDTYPSPTAGGFPFGNSRFHHYAPVEYFIDIPSLTNDQRLQQVTTNFILSEYVRIPQNNRDNRVYIDPQIALHAQELRDAWGGPLVFSSTFRSPEYNATIGGAFFSRHMYGDAVDIRVSATAAQDIYNLARFIGVDFLDSASNTIVGKNTPWIHMDDRGWPINTAETR